MHFTSKERHDSELLFIPVGNQSDGEPSDVSDDDDNRPLASWHIADHDSDSDDDSPLISFRKNDKKAPEACQKPKKARRTLTWMKKSPPKIANLFKGKFSSPPDEIPSR